MAVAKCTKPVFASSNKECIRVLIVDDHCLVRAGFRALLEPIEGMSVVGEAANGREALGLVAKCSPDVVLMDIAMRELNGLEAAAQIKKRFPDLHIIIVTMHCHQEYIDRAMRYGVSAYVFKDAAPAELELAIRAVMNGNSYLMPLTSPQEPLRDAHPDKALETLPSRQREILQLLAEGKTTKEIAFLLGVSFKTVESHRASLMKRLGIRHVPGLVCYAIEKGLISVGPLPVRVVSI